VLSKASAADHDTEWTDAASGGGLNEYQVRQRALTFGG
jgi:hypothetical protein